VLYVSRLFIGVGEAGCLVIGPALISDFFSRETRGRALSRFYLGQPLGGTAGYILLPVVNYLDLDWPVSFYIAGMPGFLIAFAIWLLPDPPRGASEGAGHHGHAGGSFKQYVHLLQNRSLLLIILAQTFSVVILVPLLHYGKKFLLDKIAAASPDATEKALEFQASLAMLAMMVLGSVGMVISGWIGDRLARRFQGAYALVAGAGFLLGWPCIFLGFRSQEFWVFLPALVAGCTCMFLCMPAVNTQIANVVHPTQRAAAWALAVFVLHLLGDTAAPPIFGKCIDVLGRQQAFEVFSAALLLASLCCFWAARTSAADIARHVNALPAEE
jgi:MFS family permease